MFYVVFSLHVYLSSASVCNGLRFVSSTDEEIEQKRLKMNAQKTNKQNIAAATLLREYLKEKHLLL